MKKYGVVLIGCGYMGAAHLDEIYFRDNIEIRGVVDLDIKNAQEFARKYSAVSFSATYAEYLNDPLVDIIIIATYPSTHLQILKNCIANGKHVLCEKPIAPNLEEAKEFVEVVKHAKSKVLVGHILRHNNTYNKVAQMIHEGAIGNPIIIRMVQNKHTSKDWGRFRTLLKNTSPIIDCGVHYIDIMEWFTISKITSVSGISAITEAELGEGSYNYGMFTANFADGSVAFYESGWGNTVASEDVKEFVGPKGRIRITYRKDRMTHQEEGDFVEYYRYPENEYKVINIDSNRKPTWQQLEYLIKMIELDVDAIPKIDEVFRAFEISLKIDEAIQTGRTIVV